MTNHLNETSRLRRLIATKVAAFFGRPIAIEERCMQFLETEPDLADEWVIELIRADPSLYNAWQRVYASEVWSHLLPRPPEPGSVASPRHLNTRTNACVTNLLAHLFRGRTSYTELDQDRFTHQGEAIVQLGTLRCVDILHGLFDDRWFYLDFLESNEEVVAHGVRALHLEAIADSLADVRRHYALDPANGRQLFVLWLDETGYRVRPMSYFGGFHFMDVPFKDTHEARLRGNVVECHKLSMGPIEELEWLINAQADEREFQAFFERNPKFLALLGGGRYKNVHSQLVLHEDSGSTLVPDFLLERVDSNLCDILDLKRSNVQLTRVVRNRMRFRDAVMDVVAQLEHYRNFFDDRRNRERFESQYGVTAYRPRVIAIIGRSVNYYDDIDRIRRDGLLPTHFEITTYDEVVSRIRNLTRLLGS